MQDYVDVHGQEEKFGARLCKRMAFLADRLYVSATTRDATSHPMLEDLLLRTGCAGQQMLHAGVEEEDLRALHSRRAQEVSEIRIAYAGTVLVEKEFALFVEALEAVRRRIPQPISIELYGSRSYSRAPWFDESWMRERGNLNDRELLSALQSCTWGFAPMALEDRDPRYNRYSFPTKFITYLAAGLPVISLGHPDSAVMKMAKAYNVGPLTSATMMDALVNAITTPLKDLAPWTKYGAEIIRCAETEFRASSMRTKLWNCFERYAEVTRDQRAASTQR